jgi:hypothetical protein
MGMRGANSGNISESFHVGVPNAMRHDMRNTYAVPQLKSGISFYLERSFRPGDDVVDHHILTMTIYTCGNTRSIEQLHYSDQRIVTVIKDLANVVEQNRQLPG